MAVEKGACRESRYLHSRPLKSVCGHICVCVCAYVRVYMAGGGGGGRRRVGRDREGETEVGDREPRGESGCWGQISDKYPKLSPETPNLMRKRESKLNGHSFLIMPSQDMVERGA